MQVQSSLQGWLASHPEPMASAIWFVCMLHLSYNSNAMCQNLLTYVPQSYILQIHSKLPIAQAFIGQTLKKNKINENISKA